LLPEIEPSRLGPITHSRIIRLTNTSGKSNRIFLNDLRAEN